MALGGKGVGGGERAPGSLLGELGNLAAYAELLADPAAFRAKVDELRAAASEAQEAKRALGIAGDAALALREAEGARAAARKLLDEARAGSTAIITAAETARASAKAASDARSHDLDDRGRDLARQQRELAERTREIALREQHTEAQERKHALALAEFAAAREARAEQLRALDNAIHSFLRATGAAG